MSRRPPGSTLTYTLFPYPTLFRSDFFCTDTSLTTVTCPVTGVALNGAGTVATVTVTGNFDVTDFGGILANSVVNALGGNRSEEHTSELQSLMRISYAVFCLKKKNRTHDRRAEPFYTITIHTR